MDDEQISQANKVNAIIWSVWNDYLNLDDVENFLLEMKDKKDTDFKRLLCAYDLKKYRVY